MKVGIKAVLSAGLLLSALYAGNFIYGVLSGAKGGTLGDTFGMVNALFSGSALFFLILAFLSQREELDLIKEERNDTKTLLEGQEAITRLQRDSLEQQRFEQSYYSILSLIAQELQSLHRPSDIERHASSVEVARVAAFSFLQNMGREDITIDRHWLDSQYPERRLSVYRRPISLVLTAKGMLDNRPRQDPNLEVYSSALRSFLDEDLATVWGALVLAEPRPIGPLTQVFFSWKIIDLLRVDIRKSFDKAFDRKPM